MVVRWETELFKFSRACLCALSPLSVIDVDWRPHRLDNHWPWSCWRGLKLSDRSFVSSRRPYERSDEWATLIQQAIHQEVANDICQIRKCSYVPGYVAAWFDGPVRCCTPLLWICPVGTSLDAGLVARLIVRTDRSVSYIHFSTRGMIWIHGNFITNHPVPVFICLFQLLAELWTGLIFIMFCVMLYVVTANVFVTL